ncbi:MAG TPA: metallophosphoesterase [Planctomycetota bacterium]|nr:metallophosphoesterase [Planctomycetota bacterium]
MKLAWATDIHLDLAEAGKIEAFVRALESSRADAFLIGGDIAKAGSVERHLRSLEPRLLRPIYFVLGNHDFYVGSIAKVRAAMTALSRRSRLLKWLPAAGVVQLTPRTALIGHDGWGDARYGNVDGTPVRLNDFVMIEELSGIRREVRRDRLRALGDEAAAYVRQALPRAFALCPHAVLLTHVPPFRESCWHDGAISNDDWLPYFTCKALGDELLAQMSSHPGWDLTVLCGHTHGAGTAELLPNLRVWTGGADYGAPRLERVVEVE